MKTEIIYCDRCGRICETSRTNHGFHLYKKISILADVHNYDAPMDLCQICYDSLAEWMKIGKADNGESEE